MALPNALNPGSSPSRRPPAGYPPIEEVPRLTRKLGWPTCQKCVAGRCNNPTVNGIHYRDYPEPSYQEWAENEVLKAWLAERPVGPPPRRELPRSQRMQSLPSLRELTK